MKKKFAFMISVLLVCTCVLGLTACSSGGNGEHKHEYENEWSFDKNEHWQICKACGGKGNVEGHSFTDGACKCGYVKGSEKLTYKPSLDDNYYIVTGMGTCNEKNISIFSTYNGKPVREIEERAFDGNSFIESVFIPNGVRKIGEKAFNDCASLSSVTIPDSVTDIEKYAFSYCALTNIVIPNNLASIKESVFFNCKSLTSVTIPSSVTSIGDYAFRGCSKLTNVTIPSSVTSIGSSAFNDCSSLKGVYITDIAKWCAIRFGDIDANPLYYAHSLYLNNELVTELVIPEGVTSIGDYAFTGYTSLMRVTIPSSVISIGSSAFSGCTELSEIFYKGTSDNWYKIEIDNYLSGNDTLSNAIRYYYSETEPTDSGNYWHYVDGVVTKW